VWTNYQLKEIVSDVEFLCYLGIFNHAKR